MNTPDPRRRDRNRLMFFALLALFVGGMLVAGVLRFSGWRPESTKNHGELLQPPADLRALQPRLADGGEYDWNPAQRRWRIAVAPPADCGEACLELARELDLVWRLFGKDADEVDILWIGAPPQAAVRNAATRVLRADPALRARLPRVDDPAGVPVYVIDPNGFVILRYAPGFDPGGLRADVARLLKLL